MTKITRSSRTFLIAMAALLIVLPASAAANWAPAGSSSALVGSGVDMQVVGSNVITTCATATVAFTVPDPASSSFSTPASSLTFAGCKTNIPGVKVKVTASGAPATFSVLFSGGPGSFTILATIPDVTATYTFFGYSCTVKAAAGSALIGDWTNESHSMAITGLVPVTGSGGACGGSGLEADFTGTFTDQTLTITP